VFVDLQEERGVLHSASLELQPEGALHVARLPWRAEFDRAQFAVTSSEVDMQSMALVGWPLPRTGVAPSQVSATREVYGRLWVDGVAQRSVERATWQGQVRRAATGLLIMVTALEAWLLLGVFLSAGHPSPGHPSTGHPSTGHPNAEPSRRGRLGFAVLAGFIVLAVAALCLLLW
jgi:hypothetical protein